MRTVDLSNVVQVGGPALARGFLLKPGCLETLPAALSTPFLPGRDGSPEECLAKYKRRLMQAVKVGEPGICSALREVCERHVEALREGFPSGGGDPGEDGAEGGVLLGYVGAEHAPFAEAAGKCAEWLVSTGAWADLPR